jgi:hypothetical protein
MILRDIILKFGMNKNEEQEAAFRIVGEHVLREDKTQLLMYNAGIGGAGKTHVVNAIRELFHILNQEDNLKLSAPTGCATVLIHGQTIHALTLLPGGKTKVNQSNLEVIWRNVQYLIIDEISLVLQSIFFRIVSIFSRSCDGLIFCVDYTPMIGIIACTS